MQPSLSKTDPSKYLSHVLCILVLKIKSYTAQAILVTSETVMKDLLTFFSSVLKSRLGISVSMSA